jgi:mono/diheme cytochrome c family protein
MRRYISIFFIGFIFCIVSFLLMSQSKKPGLTAQNKNLLRASLERGKKVYSEQCLSCHQADGGGVQNMNPPLIKTKWILGDKTKLIQVVLKGMKGETEINGDSYHNVMAPHRDLTDEQIADVLTYVRNSFGNKASAVTPAQVKSVRGITK